MKRSTYYRIVAVQNGADVSSVDMLGDEYHARYHEDYLDVVAAKIVHLLATREEYDIPSDVHYTAEQVRS